MARFKQRNVDSLIKKCCCGFLVLMIVGSLMLGCLVTAEIHPPSSAVLTNPTANGKALGCDFLDPNAYLNGFHLYNVTKLTIPSGGVKFNLSYPADWNVTGLGLNFFNGSLVLTTVQNTTTVITNVTRLVGNTYQGSISNLKIPGNSTVYQAQFNITGLKVGEPSNWMTVNGLSNSSYPTIDGNVGIAQRFFISDHALNLTIQVMLMRIEGTARNLTVEVRSSTSDNKVGGLIKAVSYAPTIVNTGSNWVTLSVPNVNLSPGYYFIVLHTDSWLGSGGGYRAETTLSKYPISPSPGCVSFNRGVNWENLVNLTSTSSYYFNGFKLKVHVTPAPTPSDLNLRINDFQVADNFMWNQSAWISAPPYSFNITSDYPITVLNFTYKAWVYTYSPNNLINELYKIQVNGYKNATAVIQNGNFTMMYVNLNQMDLLEPGVLNPSTSTVTLNLRLFYNNTDVSGNVNVTACAQLTTRKLGLTFSGPYSLNLEYNYTHLAGLYNNVTLAETALTIGPINNQIDNVFINGSRLSRSFWSYNPEVSFLFVYREAFQILPQFTLLNGSLFNCTVITFNNFTAAVSTIVTGSEPDTTPIASVQVVNSTPLIDLEGLTNVNITVTDPGGTIINNSLLSLAGDVYKFNWTLRSGAGIYGLKITSNDSTGNVATRWIGAATVNDFVLAPPRIMLARVNGTILTGNLTSEQNILILANVSYVNHPTWNFSGTVNITVYLGGTGEVDHLAATWNATTKTYSAVYDPPSVDSPIPLTIYVEAVDLKGRISGNSTFTYLLPHSAPNIPQGQPSIMGILESLIIALIMLIPVVAYIAEKRRKA
nr:hypothetical protein [Candidatus Njordarchaeota archaeon]